MRVVIVCACASMVLALSGCGSTPETHDPTPPLEQVKALCTKYLPGFSLHAEDRGGSSSAYALVDPGGSVVSEVPGWQGLKGLTLLDAKGHEYMGSPSLNALLRKRRIRVTSSDDALQIARLIVGLGRGRGTLGENWVYSAQRMDGGWLIVPKYVGPTAMVRYHGECELHVDADGLFVELRERHPTR